MITNHDISLHYQILHTGDPLPQHCQCPVVGLIVTLVVADLACWPGELKEFQVQTLAWGFCVDMFYTRILKGLGFEIGLARERSWLKRPLNNKG